MAERGKSVVRPKVPPPPPPPTPRTPNEPETSPTLNTVRTNKASPTSPPSRRSKRPPPPDLSQAAAWLSATPPSPKEKQSPATLMPPYASRPPFVNMNPAGRDPPTPKSPSKLAESTTPKKGFFQSIFSRTRNLFHRNKTTSYEPIPQLASTPPPSRKSGFFQNASDTGSNDVTSDTESSPDHSSGFSGDRNYAHLTESCGSSDLEVDSGTSSRVLRFATDTGSDVSASDMEEAEAFSGPTTCSQVSEHPEERLVTIQVNAAADIQVASTVTGEILTCVRTVPDRKRKK